MSKQDPEAQPGQPESDTITTDRGTGPRPPVVAGVLLELQPDQQVGDYVVGGVLGSGGCGQVFEARHPVLGRRVAIKVLSQELSSSEQMVQRFTREAQVVNRIHHPNIADVHDFGTLPGGRPYYVMEFLEGETLAKLISQRGRIPPAEVLEYLTPLCAALEAAHAIGVVHRDVKSSNVMVANVGGKRTVKLLDFGIAKLMQPEAGDVPLTTESQRLGSPSYMSPEQILGQPVDGRTDIYSLGVVLFCMLTGAVPFWSRDAYAIFEMHLKSEPPRPSSLAPLPGSLDAVVLKCLAKRKEDRFQHVGEVATEVQRALGQSVEAGRQPTPSPLRRARGFAVQAEYFPSETIDDDGYSVATAAMASLEAALGQQHLQTFLSTALSVLAVRVLPDEATEAKAVLVEAQQLVARLYEAATSSVPPAAGRLTMFLHVGQVDIKIGSQGITVQGGPLLNVADWPIAAEQGWYATRDVATLLASSA